MADMDEIRQKLHDRPKVKYGNFVSLDKYAYSPEFLTHDKYARAILRKKYPYLDKIWMQEEAKQAAREAEEAAAKEKEDK